MKLLRQSGLIFIIFTLLLPVLAQSDFNNEFDFENGVTIRYPDGWDTAYDDQDYPHVFSSDTDMVFFFEDYDPDLDLEDYLVDLYDFTLFDESQRFDSEAIFFGSLGDFDEIASYTYQDDADGDIFQRTLVVIPLEDEIVVKVSVIPRVSREIDEFPTVIDILSTIEYTSSNTDTGISAVTAGTYDLGDGLSIDYPEGWQALTNDEGVPLIVNSAIVIGLFKHEIVNPRQDNHASFIRQIYDQYLVDRSIDFDEDLFFFVSISNDPSALGYLYDENVEGDEYQQLLVAVQPGQRWLVLAFVYPVEAAQFSDADNEIIYSILGTLQEH